MSIDKKYTDIALQKGCLKGSSEHQRALVMQYSELLFATAVRYLKQEALAQDALQEAFLKIFKSIGNFDVKKGKLSSWMCKIVINEALKSYNKEKHKVDYNEYFSGATDKPLALDQLQVDDLYQIILELEDPYGLVFNLAIVEGYKHKEIAEKLDIKESSSRSILTRAKEMLRNKIVKVKKKEAWI